MRVGLSEVVGPLLRMSEIWSTKVTPEARTDMEMNTNSTLRSVSIEALSNDEKGEVDIQTSRTL